MNTYRSILMVSFLLIGTMHAVTIKKFFLTNLPNPKAEVLFEENKKTALALFIYLDDGNKVEVEAGRKLNNDTELCLRENLIGYYLKYRELYQQAKYFNSSFVLSIDTKNNTSKLTTRCYGFDTISSVFDGVVSPEEVLKEFKHTAQCLEACQTFKKAKL